MSAAISIPNPKGEIAMAVKLAKSALPKSKGGRKPTPLDDELVAALVDALKSNPKDGDRPAAYGPEATFDTEGKAGGQARRYAEAVSKALGKKVRVNIYPENAPEDGKAAVAPFHWRIYIPLVAQS
jgi:hypothetical protein